MPVSFFSRKLSKHQLNWTPREKETYAVVSALRKWEGWIGLQPVLVTTDHRSLEDLVKEKMDTPSGPAGRRARWHEQLSKFDITIQYIPGKDNVVADALSRYAYPACQAFQDTSFHGSEAARQEMKQIIAQELAESRMVGVICKSQPEDTQENVTGRTLWVAGDVCDSSEKQTVQVLPITTRSGLVLGEEDNGPRPSGNVQRPLNPNAAPFEPYRHGAVDEAGNALPTAMPEKGFGRGAKHPSRRTGRGRPSQVNPPPQNEQGVTEGRLDEPSSSSTGSALCGEWAAEYLASPWWNERWLATQTPGAAWPEGVRLHQNHMILDGKICLPETRVSPVLKEFHSFLGHVGIKKMMTEVERRYVLPGSVNLADEVRRIRQTCPICQSNDPPNWSLRTPLSFTPVPSHIMTSVALDLFELPVVEWQSQTYDCLLLCVDRHSGWIIARPCREQGLTAEKAAHLVLDNGWESFGIPSVITSDQGPQFVGQWWRTMCARLGIRQAYSQAYHHQANGRAEVAGKTIQALLRKVWNEDHINWVQALPRVLRIYHDLPGESGLCPFQLMFGRERNLAGLPYEPVKECQAATEFFDRMEEIDRVVAQRLNAKHRTQVARENATRSDPLEYQIGQWVWVLRPRTSKVSKLDTWWVGPVKVLSRTGAASYQVALRPGMAYDVHVSGLKPWVGEQLEGEPTELSHNLSGYQVLETAPDEWEVDEILKHRVDTEGKVTFLTRWEGAALGEETWEPVENFIPRYCYKLLQYCREHRLHIDLVNELKDQPSA